MASETIRVMDYQTGAHVRDASASEIQALRAAYEAEGLDTGAGTLADPQTGRTVYLDGIEHDGRRYVWPTWPTYSIRTLSGRGLPTEVDADGYDTREAAEEMADAEHDGAWEIVEAE